MPLPDIHAIIADTPEPMRHFYRGLFFGITYAQAQCLPEEIRTFDFYDDDLNMTYSKAGEIKKPEHFYSPQPELPENVETYTFDPLQFLAMAAELDSEAAIIYINLKRMESSPLSGQKSPFFTGWHITVTSTEGDAPPPDEMPWRNFEDFLPEEG